MNGGIPTISLSGAATARRKAWRRIIGGEMLWRKLMRILRVKRYSRKRR